MNKDARILIACEESGAVTDAFIDLGFTNVWSCDLMSCSGKHPEHHLQQDVLPLLKEKWGLIIAFPPCTDLCSSGARWFPEKRADGRQQSSIEFFMQFVIADCPRIAIENPIGIMSTLYRKPDQIIQPWQYGHPETKSTCLWLKGLPKLQPTNIVQPDYMRKENGEYYIDAKGKRYSRVHFMSRSNPGRAMLRSKTFPGIAKAMANTWSKT